jgi:putative Mg2+ transporter-C (MgtC) family protein
MTTAAGLWASACMGLCIGTGFYLASLICCVLIIFTIVIFSHLERLILSHARNINLFIEFEDTDNLARIIEAIKKSGTRIFDVEITKAKYSENHHPNAVFSLQLPKKMPHAALLSAISEIDSVRSIEEL